LLLNVTLPFDAKSNDDDDDDDDDDDNDDDDNDNNNNNLKYLERCSVKYNYK
jgi:hypothetical protein